MATKKVSALTELTSPDGSEELLVNDGGTSKKITIDNLLYDESIDSDHYVDGSIDNAHIADDAIDSEHYAAGSIDNEHLADDAVDTDEIADNAVTLDKMAGLARGKLIYGNASGNPTALAVGSADQVLTHDGTDLSWEDAATAGATTGFVIAMAIAL